MKRSKTVAGVVCALVLGASMFAGIVPAFAQDDSERDARSSISMSYKWRAEKFAGKVSVNLSNADECLSARVVKLFKARNNRVVGKTKTRSDGSWAIGNIDHNSGSYYSKVVAAEITVATGQDSYGNVWAHVLNCSGAKSDVKSTSR